MAGVLTLLGHAQRACVTAQAQRAYVRSLRCLAAEALLRHLPAWLWCAVPFAESGCIAGHHRNALIGLTCALSRRPDPDWQAVRRQIALDVARTTCGATGVSKADLKNILEVHALNHGSAYTQVRRTPAGCCHFCLRPALAST